MKYIVPIILLLLVACSTQSDAIRDFAEEYFSATSAMLKGRISEDKYNELLSSLDVNKLPKALAHEFCGLREVSYSLSSKLSNDDMLKYLMLATLSSGVSPILDAGVSALSPLLETIFNPYKHRLYKFTSALKRHGISQEWIDSTLSRYGL